MRLDVLKGIGAKTAELLAKVDINQIEDLLFYLPYRYQDRTRLVPMSDLRPDDEVVIEGHVVDAKVVFAKRRQLTVTLADKTGQVLLKFFHFNAAQQQQFKKGTYFRCFGTVKWWQNKFMIVHPEYRHAEEEQSNVEETLTPIYPTIEGFQQHRWRNLTEQALNYLHQQAASLEILPESIRKKYELTDLTDALQYVHRPPPDANQALLLEGIHPTQQRLAFEELLAHQISLRQLRQQQRNHMAIACDKNAAFIDKSSLFLSRLGYHLTQAQKSALEDIQTDLTKITPMMRLLQGDVGSGKTVVAALSALQVVMQGYQVALMAPTELLAEQHYQQFSTWFEPLGIRIAWLAGKLNAPTRRQMEQDIQTGTAQIIVGTHALFQKSVEFYKLGFIIVDEQHRFGVEQRLALREKGTRGEYYPHQLIMTATPIPRTLAMTFYADLDVSVIDELPPGRTPVKTVAINNQRRREVIAKIDQKIAEGAQIYWVCPLITESELIESEAAEKIFEQLKQELPHATIGLVHGKLKSDQKQTVMEAFKQGAIDVLVATTVIEVGINVPNASVMVIENAERMGLAQLHQLRGRVGRGAKESHCILFYQDPLSNYARERLQVMRDSTDGFYIAQRDLELRGQGELLGTRQTGLAQLRVADVMRDRKLLPHVQAAADVILRDHSDCVEPLIHRWVGGKHVFGKV